MEQLYSPNLEPYLAQLAYHFFEAISSNYADKAVGYATRAGDRGMELVAYEEAARYYEMALQALVRREPVDEGQRCQLLLSLADAQKRAGESERAREAFQQATQVARKLGAAEQLAQAAVGFEDASYRPGLLGTPAVRLLEEALNALEEEDSILRVRTLSALVRALYFSGLDDQAAALAQEAVEMARRLQDPVILAWTLNAALISRRHPESLQQRLAASTEALGLAELTDNAEVSLDIYSWYINDLMEVGDVLALNKALDVYQKRAEVVRQPFYLYIISSVRATMDIAQGRFEQAERLAKQSLALGQRLKGQDPSGVFGTKMFTIRRSRGVSRR
jgi:ATP/maltotriose-dependent transcriptional regulator MalT